MALVQRPVWDLTVTWQDNNNNTATSSVSLPGSLSFAEVQASTNLLVGAMNSVSDALVSSYAITRTTVEDAVLAPPPSSEVERKLYIPLGTSQFAKASSLTVPSPIFGLEIAGTDIIDETNGAWTVLRDLLISGLIGPGNGFSTYFGEDITRTGTPYIVHRKRSPRR